MTGRFCAWMVAAGLVAMASPAYAATITITPSTDQQFFSAGESNPNANDVCVIFGIAPCTLQGGLYKANVGTAQNPAVVEEGSLSGSYTTVFSNTALDPQDATITWNGPSSFDCPDCYLIVKDGQQGTYIFNLGNLILDGNPALPNYVWDGLDTLQLTGFWPNQGAISHVEIVAGQGENFQVPEPTSFTMLGFGLAALVARRVRKARSNS